MHKILRSFIQENFPYDLRVELELLSRRRDIVNEEKQEELINLLRKYDIPGIVPLGPGTNRYAFKLNGFVVKFATDDDGRIDNFKEFKMAKRLYPHVAKTYEVSTNGTLLIAEYIEPFQSYGDMLACADEIREILKDFSSVYLIGDVGITKKNYSNWGKRIGSDAPVCLDFAYVYDVKSELFLCKACKNNAMLVPNNDFTKLVCPAIGCGKEYEFEEIRSRLGNDIHDHEIGDLSEEGYLMYESNVDTELTPERSNYLEVKTKKNIVEEPKLEDEVTIEDDFVFGNTDSNSNLLYKNEKGGNDMLEVTGMVFESGTATDEGFVFDDDLLVGEENEIEDDFVDTDNDEDYEDYEEILDEYSDLIDDEDSEDDSQVGEVAFTESMDDDVEQDTEEELPPITSAYVVEEPVSDFDFEPDTTEEESNEVVAFATAVEEEPVVEETVEEPASTGEFTQNFLKNIHRVPLELGRKISNGYLYKMDLFRDVKDNIKVSGNKNRFYPEQFYNTLAHAINHAIVRFCEFEVKEGVNRHGNPCNHYYQPKDLYNEKYMSTLIFLQRFWNDGLYEVEDATQIMNIYTDRYSDHVGIQSDIKSVLEDELHDKFDISNVGVKMIIDAIETEWFDVSTETDEPVVNEPEVGIDDVPTEEVVEEPVVEHVDLSDDDTEDLVEETTDADEYDNIKLYFYPEVYDEEDPDEQGGKDVINIITSGAFGPVTIPLYTELKSAPDALPTQNGYWDWLKVIAPDMMVRTSNPEKYLAINDITSFDEGLLRFAILKKEDDGNYIVGMYYLGEVALIDAEWNHTDICKNDEIMSKINNVIVNAIDGTAVSHLEMTLSRPDLIMSEAEFDEAVHIVDVDDDEDNDEEVDNLVEDEAEEAALGALLGEESMTFKPIHRMKD